MSSRADPPARTGPAIVPVPSHPPSRRQRALAAQALVDVCRGRPPATSREPAFVSDLVAAARHHRIAPLTHVLLRERDPALADRLREDRDAAVAMQLRAAVGLDHLDRVLDGVPWAAFKGPILSELAHPVPGLRTFRDLDVLVHRDSLREVTTRFLAAGWEPADYRDTLTMAEARGEMHWRTGTGLMVDLHWSMLNMAEERRWFHVPTADLLGRRRRLDLPLASTYALDPVDAFVHVCLHAAMSGADRMQYLLDIDQLTRVLGDWDAVVDRARRWRVGTPVALALRRTRAVLGSPVPDVSLRRLGGPPGLPLLLAATDRLVPVPSLRGDASAARLVSRAARPGSGRTYAALVTKSSMALRSRLPYRRSPDLDAAPADATALETYLCRVERDGTPG